MRYYSSGVDNIYNAYTLSHTAQYLLKVNACFHATGLPALAKVRMGGEEMPELESVRNIWGLYVTNGASLYVPACLSSRDGPVLPLLTPPFLFCSTSESMPTEMKPNESNSVC